MEKISYEDAVKELYEIISKIESGTLPLNETISLISKGKSLIKSCYADLDKAKGKLTEVKETLGTLFEEDC